MFGIEYCGEYWHRYEPYKNNKNYHQEKTQYFLNKNITIMTIFESEWKTNQNLIKSMIKTRLGICDKIYARKCEIKEISDNQKVSYWIVRYWMSKYGIKRRSWSDATYVKRNPNGDPFRFKKSKPFSCFLN